MWTQDNIPDQTGKTVLVTGANSGLGFEIAKALYTKGAHVIVAARDQQRIDEAAEKIKNSGGNGTLETATLNLANLAQIKTFSQGIISKHQQLNLLINNAGVMIPPESKTDDGFELQFGVNFLGHFALTAQLYSLLKQTPGSRIVTLSSGAHHAADAVDFENLKLEKSYDAFREYAVSKLANLQFMATLQRKIAISGDAVISTAAHPGVTKTSLSRHMPEADYNAAVEQFGELMPAWQGALSALFAATSASVEGGDYFGPDGENELQGFPAPAKLSIAATDIGQGEKLWQYAEKATQFRFP